MAFELYPEHVEHLALHPIRTPPYPRETRASLSVCQVRFHSKPSILRNRIKLNNNIELLTRALRPVNHGLIGTHIEDSFAIVMQQAADLNQRFLLDANHLLAERSDGFSNVIYEARAYVVD